MLGSRVLDLLSRELLSMEVATDRLERVRTARQTAERSRASQDMNRQSSSPTPLAVEALDSPELCRIERSTT